MTAQPPSANRSVVMEDSGVGTMLCVELVSLAGGLERIAEFGITFMPLAGSTEGRIAVTIFHMLHLCLKMLGVNSVSVAIGKMLTTAC